MIDEQLRTIQSTVWLARFIVKNTNHLKGTEADAIIKEAKKIMLKDMGQKLQCLYDDCRELKISTQAVCMAEDGVNDELSHLS